jgi:RNA-directed DNA polymerase
MSCQPNAAAFPLSLNLWELKHLEYALCGYPIKSLRYFVDQKKENIKALAIITNQHGKRKERIVYNPSEGFKTLLKIINKKILQKAILPNGILGGVIGKAIDDMAICHCGHEALFAMDFKNFFPNIKSGMVFKFFQRAKCSSEIAGILTDLITLDKALPLGFPTSPMMANLIAFDLDIEHLKIAKKHKLMRTRWIDDIVVSGRSNAVQKSIPFLVGSVKPFGFTVNNKKTRFKARSEKPVVVGLEVSRSSPHVPLVQIHEIERLLEMCESESPAVVQATYDPKGEGRIKDLPSSLGGRIRFVAKYDPEIALSFSNRMKALHWALD